MSFTQLAVTGAVIALLAPSTVKACGAGFALAGADAAAFLAIATVTLPLWIVPAAVCGVVVGVKTGANDVKDAVTPSLYRTSATVSQSTEGTGDTETIRPFFEEAEKNPTPLNLLRLGIHLNVVGKDFIAARRFVRRCIDMIKKQNPDSWDTTDPKNLVLLALAFQQLGGIQLEIQSFDDAYDYYVECKRILDNLSKISQETKQTASLQEQQQQIGSHEPNSPSVKNTETFNILSEETANHNIGFALLHKALYLMPHECAEEKQKMAAAVETATAMMKKCRGVSDDYELHYIISEFYNFTQHLEDTCPPHDNPETFNARDFTDPWYSEFVPKFVAEFKEKIFPLFFNFVAKLKLAHDESSIQLWMPAAHYLSRCYYILGGDENITLAENIEQKIWKIAPADPIAVDAKINFNNFKPGWWMLTDRTLAGTDAVSRFKRITSVLVPFPLEALHQGNFAGSATHEFEPYKCTRPTFCSKCTKFISWDENKAGVFRCRHCFKFVLHQKCKEELGNDAVCPIASNKEEMENHKHVMRKRTLHSPHFCSFCSDLIKNPFGAFSCETCTAFFVHESCLAKMNNVLVAK